MKLKDCLLMTTIGILFVVGNSGCSAVMAAKQPEKKDLSVLNEGTHKSLVRAELGTPAWTGTIDGYDAETYVFVKGYSKVAKTARAFGHGAADCLTLGIWEVVGTPVESYASGTKTTCTVKYENEKVKSMNCKEAD